MDSLRDRLFKGANITPARAYDGYLVEVGSCEHIDNIPCYAYCRAFYTLWGMPVETAVSNVYLYCNCEGPVATIKHALAALHLVRKMPLRPSHVVLRLHDLSAHLFVTRQRCGIHMREHTARARLWSAIRGYGIETSFELGDGSMQKEVSEYIEGVVRATKRISQTFDASGNLAEDHYSRIRRRRLEEQRIWKHPSTYQESRPLP